MGKSTSQEALVKLLAHINALESELDALNKEFPLNQTALFHEKCKHLRNILGVSGPELKFSFKDRFNVSPLKDAQEEISKNFDEYKTWLQGLKFHVSLVSDITPTELSKIKRKLEMEGKIPLIGKVKWSAEDK